MREPIPGETTATDVRALLAQLQETLDSEIPMCRQMGIRVLQNDPRGLCLSMPLAPNRNHQKTAFAGSLNALCTAAGWGSVFLLTRERACHGSIVIRRSSIKFMNPVDESEISAVCTPVEKVDQAHFFEMLEAKGQAKIDLNVKIENAGEVAVAFHGSYVVFGHE